MGVVKEGSSSMTEVSILFGYKHTVFKITLIAHRGPGSLPSVLKMKVSVFLTSSSKC